MTSKQTPSPAPGGAINAVYEDDSVRLTWVRDGREHSLDLSRYLFDAIKRMGVEGTWAVRGSSFPAQELDLIATYLSEADFPRAPTDDRVSDLVSSALEELLRLRGSRGGDAATNHKLLRENDALRGRVSELSEAVRSLRAQRDIRTKMLNAVLLDEHEKHE